MKKVATLAFALIALAAVTTFALYTDRETTVVVAGGTPQPSCPGGAGEWPFCR